MLKPTCAVALMASLALLGACSKPADTAGAAANDAAASASNAADATTTTAANATDNATAPGGAVSPPAANNAVNTDANATATDTAAASNSFTEAQARGHLENAGYTDVSGLTKTPDGLWTGKAKKGGKPMDVSVDFKGAISAK